jgi:3',5'-nucleoside bisphosphate phosphatase
VTLRPHATRNADLHLHTTASDGRSTPREVVDLAATAGLRAIAVTDHDTTAFVGDVETLARERGIEAVPGIEMTAVENGRDVHVLGYFIDPAHPHLAEFLVRQRASRVARVAVIGQRLSELGVPIDLSRLMALAQFEPTRSIGRPQVARAMVSAGHVADVQQAFDRWLGFGGPAFVPRMGATPEVVVSVIHEAGGLASLAHPGRTNVDERIAALREAGLDALEVHHPDHDAALVARYERVARDLDLLITGGSDFHGDPDHGLAPGAVSLPEEVWERLSASRYRHARQR